jgi:hypothetical protein
MNGTIVPVYVWLQEWVFCRLGNANPSSLRSKEYFQIHSMEKKAALVI